MLGKLAKEGTVVDAYWADNACIDEHADVDHQTEAGRIQEAYKTSGWSGLYFGGTAFKKQRHVDGKWTITWKLQMCGPAVLMDTLYKDDNLGLPALQPLIKEVRSSFLLKIRTISYVPILFSVF